jgi:hypothetical protein
VTIWCQVNYFSSLKNHSSLPGILPAAPGVYPAQLLKVPGAVPNEFYSLTPDLKKKFETVRKNTYPFISNQFQSMNARKLRELQEHYKVTLIEFPDELQTNPKLQCPKLQTALSGLKIQLHPPHHSNIPTFQLRS